MALSSKQKRKNLTRSREERSAPLYCLFCKEEIKKIDYKDYLRISRFITERSRSLPRSKTGVCAKHQRQLARAIKNARITGLLSFTGRYHL